METKMSGYAAYIRRSTFDQENEHQVEAVRDWLDQNDVDVSDVRFLSETASGASRSREEFRRLLGLIEDGEIDHVVVWELSRIAREGELAQRFFNECEDQNVHVHITSGSIREIQPDGTNRFVADILAAVYAEERRTLIRRTKIGQKRALNNEKWVGHPPLGFTTDDDGYLIANVELYKEEFNPDRDGFYAIEEAMRQLDEDDDASYRSLARDLICSRPALSSTFEDEAKRLRYLDRTADDERVQSALDDLDDLES